MNNSVDIVYVVIFVIDVNPFTIIHTLLSLLLLYLDMMYALIWGIYPCGAANLILFCLFAVYFIVYFVSCLCGSLRNVWILRYYYYCYCIVSVLFYYCYYCIAYVFVLFNVSLYLSVLLMFVIAVSVPPFLFIFLILPTSIVTMFLLGLVSATILLLLLF